uniref:Jacalin-type lectin domain-containing protein n=1 Tax=Rhizophora mucronata TaxID=61149 RepID=A0A2P2JHV5_RHIMU
MAQACGVIRLGPWGRETPTENRSFVGKIEEIVVCHDVVINSITFFGRDGNDKPFVIKFGGDGGTPHKVGFACDEYITNIAGAYGYWLNKKGTYVTAITFVTNLGTTYGPFGNLEDKPAGVTKDTVKFYGPLMDNATIAGFFAYCDHYVQNIGMNVRSTA